MVGECYTMEDDVFEATDLQLSTNHTGIKRNTLAITQHHLLNETTLTSGADGQEPTNKTSGTNYAYTIDEREHVPTTPNGGYESGVTETSKSFSFMKT